MIDFEYTEESNGVVSFVNEKGETVKTYPLSELEQYVTSNHLNLSYVSEDTYSGSGDVRDPAEWDSQEVEVVQPVSEYLDDVDNFLSATKAFYIDRNPVEFKSANREQRTIREVACG